MNTLVKVWNAQGRRGVYFGSLSYKGGKEHRWTLTYFQSGRHEISIVRYQRARNRSGSIGVHTYPMRGEGRTLAEARLRSDFPL